MKRALSLLLCLVTFVSCFSLTAFAADAFGLKAEKVTANSVKLVWNENKNASNYHVYRSTSENEGFEEIASVRSEKYTDKKVDDNTAYYYKVRGSTGNVFKSYTEYSETIKVQTEEKPELLLNKTYIKPGAGETFQLKATEGLKPVYTSDNTSVATVDKDGKITAIKYGVAIITAECDGATAECKVDVRNVPKSISLGRKTLTLGVGETYKFDISSDKGSASYSNKYVSSNESVATVDEGRNVTALRPGKTTITMTSYNGLKTTCVVTVKNAPESVKLNYENATIAIGKTVDLDSFVNDGAGAYLKKYTTDKPDVVKIGKAGLITGLAEGEAVVTLTTYNDVKATCRIKVVDAPESIAFNKTNITIGVGEEYANDVKIKGGSEKHKDTIEFFTSDKSVAIVSTKGVIKGVKAGNAEILAKTPSGLKSICTVTVKNAPSSASINVTKKTIFLADTYKLKVTLPEGTASMQSTWTSSRPEVATVNEKGVVTPHSKGTTVITYTAFNGTSVSSEISTMIVKYKKAYTAAQVRKDVALLEETYPELINTEIVGHSVKGSPIPLVKLGKGDRKALITAGIHAREYLTTAFAMRCIEEYSEAYYSKSGKYGEYDMVTMLDEYTLYIVPMMNPDGLDIVTNGKKTLYDKSLKDINYKRNANGVNLNRNFPFEWEKITTGRNVNDDESYRGKSAGSEPETQAMMTLCELHEFEWMYSMHLYGNNIYWRDKVNGVIPGDEALVNKLNKVCGFIISPSTTDVNSYGGGFENWFRQTYKKPGFCVELVPLDRNYRYEIERTKDFNNLTNWSKTRYAFIQGMI